MQTVGINTDLGLRLGLSSDMFLDAFCWDIRPNCLCFVRLKAKPDVEDTALYEFFRLGSKIFSPIEIWAPEKNVAVWAKKWGYEEHVDPAGTPYLSDRHLKTSSKE